MKTVVLNQPGELQLLEAPAPPGPAAGEALVRVGRIGICGTDFHALRGRQPFFTYPRILGHELGVEVVEVGPGVGHVRPGDRCAVEPYLNCGRCIACRRGRSNCCVELRVLGVHIDGGMRERIVVPASKLHRSETLSLEQLALVETLGIGAHAVARAALEPGERVLVIGAGPIGLGVMQFALLEGAEVIAMDIDGDRLAFCRRQLGITDTIDASSDPMPALCELTGGDLPTAVFDATGQAQSMMRSFDYAAHGGRLIFVGLVQGEITFYDPDLHRRELTLLASRNATPADFGRIMQLLEAGKIDTRPWITHRAVFDQAPQILPQWLEVAERPIKAMLTL